MHLMKSALIVALLLLPVSASDDMMVSIPAASDDIVVMSEEEAIIIDQLVTTDEENNNVPYERGQYQCVQFALDFIRRARYAGAEHLYYVRWEQEGSQNHAVVGFYNDGRQGPDSPRTEKGHVLYLYDTTAKEFVDTSEDGIEDIFSVYKPEDIRLDPDDPSNVLEAHGPIDTLYIDGASQKYNFASGTALVTMKSSWLSGYEVYLDGTYIGTDGMGSDILDGVYNFEVPGDMEHTIELMKNRKIYPETGIFLSGASYRFTL